MKRIYMTAVQKVDEYLEEQGPSDYEKLLIMAEKRDQEDMDRQARIERHLNKARERH